MNDTADPFAAIASRLSLRIRPILAGHHPGVQGAALADLLSVWLAGHHPDMREEVFRVHMELVREMIPQSEKEIFPDGTPWET